jgi:hypothetical protein
MPPMPHGGKGMPVQGLGSGFIIASIRDAAHLWQLVKELPRSKRVPLLVKRDEGALYLAVEIPAQAGQAG